MKTKSPAFLVLLAALAATIFLISQPSRSQSNPQGASPGPDSTAPPVLYLDRTNWNVFDPYNRGLDLSKANPDEARYARWKAVLAIEFPDEHARRFPPTAEQQQIMRDSAYGIEHSQRLEDYLNQPRSAEEQEALERALDSILNPQPAAQ